MNIKNISLATLLLFSIGISGCVTVGKEFPVEKLEQIKTGTSRAEIEQIFGQPWRVGRDSGYRTWTYAHYKIAVFGDIKTRDLVIRFDNAGQVVSYTFNSTYKEDEGQ